MTYTVQSVAPDPRSYDANGPKLAYKVRFAEHADKEVEWSQNATTQAPQPGQTVEGSIDWSGKWGPKFKRSFQQQGGGSSSSTGGSTWKPKDPGEVAAIQRQHSQEMALRFLAVNAAAVQATQGKRASEALDAVVKPLVDWFQRDITAGQQLAKADAQTRENYGQQRKDSVRTGQSDVPSLAEGFEHGRVPTGDVNVEDLPF